LKVSDVKLTLVLAAFATVSPARGNAEEELLRLLPESTSYAVVTRDCAAAWSQARLESHGKDAEGVAKNGDFWTACGLAPEALAETPVSCLLRAETRQAEGHAARLIAAEAETADQAADLLKRARQRLSDAGGAAATARLGKMEGVKHTWQAEDGRESTAVHLLHGNLLICASDVALAEELATRLDDPSRTGPPALGEIMRALPERGAEDRLQITWYGNPWIELNAAAARSAEDRSLVATAKRHGLDAVLAVGGVVSVRTSGDVFSHLIVRTEKPHRGSLRILQLGPLEQWELPQWLPQEYSELAVLHGDVPAGLRYVGAVFDGLYADGTEGTYEDILADLKDEYGLGVDLEKELYPHLGPRVVWLLGKSRDETPGPVLLALQTGSPEKVAATLRLLMEGDPDVQEKSVAGCEYPLWQITGGGGVPDSGVIVARGYILCCEDVGLIHQALAAGNSKATELVSAADNLRQLAGPLGLGAPCMLLARQSAQPRPAPDPARPPGTESIVSWLLFGSPDASALSGLLGRAGDAARSTTLPLLKGFPVTIGYDTPHGYWFFSRAPATE
jgi:hypothetical protein